MNESTQPAKPTGTSRRAFLKTSATVLSAAAVGTFTNGENARATDRALQIGWNVTESMGDAHADGLDITGDDRGRTHTTADWLNASLVALIDMHNHTTYRNIVVGDVRHDGKPYQLFSVQIKLAPETHAGLASYRQGLVSVDGNVFHNITAEQKPLHLSVFGGNGSELGTTSNVALENLRIAGTLVAETNASAYIVKRGKTSGFNYVPSAGITPGKNTR